MRRRAQGKVSFQELGRRLGFCEKNDLRISYMGYAVKTTGLEGKLAVKELSELVYEVVHE